MRFVNQSFVDADITLDYNEFVDCTFSKCRIHYAGGQFSLVNAQMVGDNTFAFHEAANRTLTWLKLIGSNPTSGEQVIRQLIQSAPTASAMKLN
jgi:hypothetical protein